MTVHVKRIKMCQNKVSFTSKGAAVGAAQKHGQRVYECPICYCWHCTSKPLEEEYVDAQKHRNALENNKALVEKMRKQASELKAANILISELRLKLKEAKK